MVLAPAKSSELRDVLYRLKRGLAGYVSYLAACEMNQAFSEYVLYEPILRILTTRGFEVQCEYQCPGAKQAPRGDKKRIDFYAARPPLEVAIEVKWVKARSPKIGRDVDKLQQFLKAKPNAVSVLLLFGRKSHLKPLNLCEPRLSERGDMVVADLGKTRYGCRVFQLRPQMVAAR